MKFRVERKNWLRGEGSIMSRLLREQDGKMCCLGFAALACGYTADEIKGIGSPAALLDERKLDSRFPEGFVYAMDKPIVSQDFTWKYSNTATISDAMRVNDDRCLSDEEREQQITEHLKKVGLEVEFV